jgi:hypothetical protein
LGNIHKEILQAIIPTGPTGIVRGGRGVAGHTVALLGAISSPMRSAWAIGSTIRGHDVVKFATGRWERRLTDDEYRILGTALCKAALERVWKTALAAKLSMILTGGDAAKCWPAMVGDRYATTNCTTGRHQDRRIALRVSASRLCYDRCTALDQQCGVPCPFRCMINRRGSEDVVEDHQAGRSARRHPLQRTDHCHLARPQGHNIAISYVHSADAGLLAAAGAVANATMKLMAPDEAQPKLRDQQ